MAEEVPDISSVFHHLETGGLAFNGSLRPVSNLLSHNHPGKISLPPGGGGEVAKSCLTLATPWTVAHQAPLSMGFPREEYWSG